MNHVSITEARDRLGHLVDVARSEPVYLTRRGEPAAVLISAAELSRLEDALEELDDIRAVDEAWKTTRQLDETAIPWAEVKADLGLT